MSIEGPPDKPAKRDGRNPDDDIAVSKGELAKALEKVSANFDAKLEQLASGTSEEVNRLVAELERRNDEAAVARERTQRQEYTAMLKDVVDQMNATLRKVTAEIGGRKNDVVGEFLEMIKPAVQQHLLPGVARTQEDADAVALETLLGRAMKRQINNDLTYRMKVFLKENRLTREDLIEVGMDHVVEESAQKAGLSQSDAHPVH